MKLLALWLATTVALAATGYLLLPGKPKPVNCDLRCVNDISVANYLGFNEMDCDGQIPDLGGDNNDCADELADIHMAPITTVSHEKSGGLIVTITYRLKGGVMPFDYTVRFNKDGQVTEQG